MKCLICKKQLEPNEAYEYRGAISCEEHFDEVQSKRDFERQEILVEEKHKTEKFRGLDLGNSAIGKANRQILKRDIEIAQKESGRIAAYEHPELLKN